MKNSVEHRATGLDRPRAPKAPVDHSVQSLFRWMRCRGHGFRFCRRSDVKRLTPSSLFVLVRTESVLRLAATRTNSLPRCVRSAAALVIAHLIAAKIHLLLTAIHGLQTPTSPSLRPHMMSPRNIAAAFQAGFGGKADAGAHNLRPGCGNRGTAACVSARRITFSSGKPAGSH